MPAYNHEKYVGPAVESVLGQTHTDLELVIVDDGSTDETASVIKQFKDSRIRYHYQSNQDAFNALNKGMELARGEWWSILNSDDIYHPERLASCLAAGRDVVFTNLQAIDDTGQVIPRDAHYWYQWHERNREHYRETEDLYAGFLRGNLLVTTSNLFVRATCARQIGGFKPLRYLHDYDYMFRLLTAYPDDVDYLMDQTLLQYRIHAGNTLKQGAIDARQEDLALIQKYTLAAVPDTERTRVETGLQRVIELERELAEVRRQLRWGPLLPLVKLAHGGYRAIKGNPS